MNISRNIRAGLAAFLLCVFALASMPKKYIHDVVTHHHHSGYKQNTDGKAIVQIASYYCQCDNLVATEFFTAAPDAFFVTVPVLFLQEVPSIFIEYSFSTLTKHTSLRGPPYLA